MSKQISTFLFSLIYFHTHWTICLIIYAMSILIQSIHTRKIKRFAFACPRETFSNRVFFSSLLSIYYFFFIIKLQIIFRKEILWKEKKNHGKIFIYFSFSENFCRIEWNSDRLGGDSRVWRHITNSTGSHGSDSLERRLSRQ